MLFNAPRPHFGDLFQICGSSHPLFPPTGAFGFERLADLGFDQIDDYFGVSASDDAGDDVVVWLFPLVNGREVDHHHGPFDGVRLSYNILRNPEHRTEQFIRCVEAVSGLGVRTLYREVILAAPLDLSRLRADIAAIAQQWRRKGVVPGSDDALKIR